MKKNLIFLLPLLIITLQGLTQTTCGLFIGTDFSSECLLSEYDRNKPNPHLDETVCFRACQGNIVQYYAQGMSNASFEWTVQGSDNWQVIAGDAIAVTWPEGTQSGNIIVTATDNSTGHTCTFNRCIELISKPNVGIQTFPDADISGTMPVLNICLGQQVQFQDNSSASADAPIVGYLWEWDNTAFPTQTTQNIDVTFDQPGVFILTHEIINECGCTDQMHFEVRVSESPSLQLECYGTVCANELSTYRIVNMQCTDYIWDITGGDLISFNYPELTIQ